MARTKSTGSGTRRAPVRPVSATKRNVTPTRTADSVSSTVAGVRISHPDRLIYPDLGISKIQLARYYEEIADWIVPHVTSWVKTTGGRGLHVVVPIAPMSLLTPSDPARSRC